VALSSTCLLHSSAQASTIGPRDQSPRSGPLPMSSEESVTPWLRRLKAGDRGAAEPLWRVYCHRLIALAPARLRDAPRRAAEEAVALSAFDSFCRRAERGEFPRLEDRNDLWQLLIVLTIRKAVDLRRHETRERRGSGRVLVLADLEDDEIESFLGSEPTPEL